MSWQKEVDEIGKRKKLAEAMGGPEKLKKQKADGKLNARERIAGLVDKGSFREIGQLGGAATYDAKGDLKSFLPSNMLFGRAKIEGRPVVVQSDDFTVRGGAADAAIHEKLVQSEKLAGEYRMPLVRMIEGTGGGGSVKTLETMGFTYVPEVPGWELMVENLSTIPVVALGLGPVAGLGAGRQVMAHYSVLVKGLSQMFVAGPPVVAAVGENRTKEDLGGSAIHAKNGAIDDEAVSEADAFAQRMQAAVHEYVRALNAGDLDAIVALYADEATVEDPVGSAPKCGREAIRAFYAGSVVLKLDVAMEGELRCVGHECAFAFAVSFTHEGRRTTIRPIDTMRFDDAGRIVQMRAFFGPNVHPG